MTISDKTHINWISIHDRRPDHKERCLIWDRCCHCSLNGSKESITHIYIARFFQGEHRPNGPWRSCDTGFGNNEFPWVWEEGARTWWSQDVTHWARLPHYLDIPRARLPHYLDIPHE